MMKDKIVKGLTYLLLIPFLIDPISVLVPTFSSAGLQPNSNFQFEKNQFELPAFLLCREEQRLEDDYNVEFIFFLPSTQFIIWQTIGQYQQTIQSASRQLRYHTRFLITLYSVFRI